MSSIYRFINNYYHIIVVSGDTYVLAEQKPLPLVELFS